MKNSNFVQRLCLSFTLLFSLTASASLKEVDALIERQQYQEAQKKLIPLVEEAKQKKHDLEYAKLLVKEVLLKVGLHGYETAVEDLRNREWPKEALAHSLVAIIYAHTLSLYEQAYSWEIRKREKISEKGAFDLKKLTMEEIYAEALTSYQKAWAQREKLGTLSRDTLADTISPNTYPKEIRGTLRDTVTYLLIDILNDSSHWSPADSNEAYLLDLPGLVNVSRKVAITESVHPLVKISSILGDLESWHSSKGNKNGALEARLQRYRVLSQHFTTEENKKQLISLLKNDLEKNRKNSWVAMGYADLAELYRGMSESKSLILAMETAKTGDKLFSSTPGGARCRDIMKEIKHPHLDIAGMNIDGDNKRSLGLNYKNLRKVWFKSVQVDFMEFIKTTKDYSLRPGWRELEGILKKSPSHVWSKDLPETKDYKTHKFFVVPPKHKKGFYVIFASTNENFSGGIVTGVQTFFSELTYNVSRIKGKETFQVEVLNGETGKPVKDATVSLWQGDYQNGHSKKTNGLTGANGIAELSVRSFMQKSYGQYFFIVQKGEDLVASKNLTYMYSAGGESESMSSAFVYTDRSIYRPEQKVLWKVVSYEGNPGNKKYKVRPRKEVDVQLFDANGEVVQKKTVKTNEFGSASGEFLIPKGKLLGNWRLEAGEGMAYLKVEEYKRPTFLVEVSDKGKELRLNKEAIIQGFGKYYFGMPLSTGTAKWTVHRRVILPWWCFWGGWNWGRTQNEEMISSGSTKLDSDGSFEIKFLPKANSLGDDIKDIKYNYAIKIDVTDEGGETQSTEYNQTIGFTAVNATLVLSSGFVPEKEKATVTFTRTDLSGGPLPGKGKWKLVKLKEPKSTPSLSDIPMPKVLRKIGKEDFKHEDDLKLERWNTNWNLTQYLRDWEKGSEILKGDLNHPESGRSEITLQNLSAGPYRLIYETKDSFGEEFTTQLEFFVAGKASVNQVPVFLAFDKSSAEPGEVAKLFVTTGYPDKKIALEFWRSGTLLKRMDVSSGMIDVPVKEEDRGGFSVTARFVHDYQEVRAEDSLMIPWSNKEVELAFSTFRDKLRPGSKETWSVTVKPKDKRKIDPTSFELLTYMYDKSLDSFTPHTTPLPLSLYSSGIGASFPETELGPAVLIYTNFNYFPVNREYNPFNPDRVNFYPSYGIGGPGMRTRGGYGGGILSATKGMAEGVAMEADMAAAPAPSKSVMANTVAKKRGAVEAASAKPTEVRTNFSENAFWKPHLVPGKDGSVKFDFIVPDSVTSWQVWVHGISKDLQSGRLNKEARTIKELMVRPYLPRFFREGDEAQIKVVINNSGDQELSGELEFEISELVKEKKSFKVKAQGSTNLTFRVNIPVGPRSVKVQATARSGNISDGEVRELPILPGRMHLAESKFVTLKNKDSKSLTFNSLEKNADPSLVHDLFVVTLDAQLFYSVLSAVPYLVNYPYQSTEMMMNAFVSSGILSSVFSEYPEVGKMAREFSNRKTRLESWDSEDPNRKLALEEAPWLNLARGGNQDEQELMSILHPDIARNTRNKFLRQLKDAQTASGGFPWFPGGPPSPYVTLDLLYGFSKAIEFKVDVPKDVTARAWKYLHQHYIDVIVRDLMHHDVGWEIITYLNYVLSNYPDESYGGGVFSQEEKRQMLEFTFKHWKEHSPYMKSFLAMNLKRAKRDQDAKLVWDSVMDSAKTTDEEGTHWMAEDRSWLWYNDTIQTHAMALRTGQELGTRREQLDGLVHWLFLNKKLNHWKSTKATAEVVYSLTNFLKKTKQLGVKEEITVTMAGKHYDFVFDPDKYTGKKNQIVIEAKEVSPKLVPVTVSKKDQGLAFASATWHYSTEKLPKEAVGDFFSVKRSYFRRVTDKKEMKLIPIKEGDKVSIGDEVEVQLSLTGKHQADYVHLRDPRPAGFEPIGGVSQHKWDLGIYWYEEIRDSATNFFFEKLPQGQYSFRYRIRASTAGKFRAGPAQVQPLYAPEFVGFSEGHEMIVE